MTRTTDFTLYSPGRPEIRLTVSSLTRPVTSYRLPVVFSRYSQLPPLQPLPVGIPPSSKSYALRLTGDLCAVCPYRYACLIQHGQRCSPEHQRVEAGLL